MYLCPTITVTAVQSSFLPVTQQIQRSLSITTYGVTAVDYGYKQDGDPASFQFRFKLPAEASIFHFNLWPKYVEQLTNKLYKFDFTSFYLCEDLVECTTSPSTFSDSRTPESCCKQLRYNLSSSAAETKSALRSRLVRESSKRIKSGIILRFFLQGGLCASGLHSYHSFEGTDDSTVQAQG